MAIRGYRVDRNSSSSGQCRPKFSRQSPISPTGASHIGLGAGVKFGIIAALVLCVVSLPTQAAIFKVTPVGPDNLQIRYSRGEPQIYSLRDKGVILVVSGGMQENKRLAFDILAFNKSSAPQNFGTENISLTGKDGKAITVFGFDELTRQAERKATWAKIFLGVASVAETFGTSESGYTTTHGSISSPYGSATFSATTYDPAVARAEREAADRLTQYRFDRIQANLDTTLARLNNSILRTTTIDPGHAFGGQVVTDSIKGGYPQTVVLKINWVGEEHTIEFIVTKGNQPTPPIPMAVPLETASMPETSDMAGRTPASGTGSRPSDDYAPPQSYSATPPESDIQPGIRIPYPDEN